MTQAIGIATVVLSLVLLWSGKRGLEFGSLARTLLSVIEIAVFALAVISLGWLGVALFGTVNLLASLVWSVKLAMTVESKLVYAGIRIGESKESMKALADRLAKQKALKAIGPVERAELIRLLADRTRTVPEIEEIAVPVATLKTIYDEDLDWVANSFDEILRLAGEPATNAEHVADILHNTTCNTASTFREVVEGLIMVYTDLAEAQAA